MAETELRNMIMNFRVSDLQVLLGFAGRNKTGKKQELQMRAMDLIKLESSAVNMKIRELHNRRYVHQLVTRTTNCEPDRSMQQYNAPRNNYADPIFPNVRSNSGRPAQMNHGPSSSYMGKQMYPPQIPNASSQPMYTYSDVKFKELPFYDIMNVLVRPCSLISDTSDRLQETTLYFTLTRQQAENVSFSRDDNMVYVCQILLRFCVLDTSCEQDDNFPPSVSVKVNGRIISLPNPIPTNRPGVEPKRPSRPVNITTFSKISPTVTNTITISWTSTYGRSYAAAVYLAHQLNSSALLQRLKENGVRNPDFTTAMIREKLQQGQDAEIATTSLRGSLVCPLGKIKMELPCRALTCNHLQCFDASLYIQMNEKKPKWICPVCDKPAVFRTLFLDGLFMDIATKVPSECTEVQFNEDGSWTPIMPVKEPKEKKVEKRPKKVSVEVVDILSDSDSDDAYSGEKAFGKKSPLSLSNEAWPFTLDPQPQKSCDKTPLIDVWPFVDSQNPTDKTPPLASVASSPLTVSSPTLSLSLPSPTTQSPSSRPLSPQASMFVPSPSQLVDDSMLMSSVTYPSLSYPSTSAAVEPNSKRNGVLPDLGIPHMDASMPSTSSNSLGLNLLSYPHMSSYADSYYTSLLSSIPEQIPSTSGSNQSISKCDTFDLEALLHAPPDSIPKVLARKESDPDVISLD